MRWVWASALAFAVLTVLALPVDGSIADLVQGLAPGTRSMVNSYTGGVEILFGFNVSKFATGGVLVLVAALMFLIPRTRAHAGSLMYVGVVHLVTRLLAGVLKNVFLRPRPYEVLSGTVARDQFFAVDGSSFPSGHAAHFWALFFALAVAYPKTRIPALVLAVAMSAARVVVNDHYLSDVLASAAIAALVSYLCAFAIRKPLAQRVVN